MAILGNKRATADLQEHLGALSERVSQLESDLRRVQLDYLETYDKVKRLMSRVAKRAAVDHPIDDAGEQHVDDKFSHLDPISAEIMRRRANGAR